jgi:parallel beta-helix repeat protein
MYNESIASLDRAIELDPSNAALWNNKGAVLNKMSRYKEALQCYNRSLQINPRYTVAWNNRGAAFNNLGNYEAAIDSYNQSISLNPSDPTIWKNIGVALNNLGEHNESLVFLNMSLKMNPRDPEAWGTKGMALSSLDRYEEAASSFNKSLELDPDNAEILGYQGYVLKSLGRDSEAESALQRAKELQRQTSPSTNITVGPTGCDYTRIRAAVDAANPGDTIEVHSGIYNENLNIHKRVILIGMDTGDGIPVVNAKERGSSITLSADGITLKGFNATNSGLCKCGDAGIKVRSNGNTIVGNTAYGNKYGIYIDGGKDSILYLNRMENNNISAYDNSTNYWSNEEQGIVGMIKSFLGFKFQGNSYSDYSSLGQGCTDSDGDGICDSPRAIKGGSNIDRYPLAARKA